MKCRNCDAPIEEGKRYCPECGADSQAKRFSRNDDLIAENTRLKKQVEDLEEEKKKGFVPPAPAPKKTDDDI